MVILEALNALYGDCLLLRYPGPDRKKTEQLWVIDGGPRSEKVDGKPLAVWRDVLLPRLKEISSAKTLPVALGMVSHIDDDHINGILKLTNSLVAATPAKPPAVKFARFWFNSFDDLVGPKPAGLSDEVVTASMASVVEEALPGIGDEHAELVMQSVPQGIALAADLRSLKLKGNKPFGGLIVAKKEQGPVNVEGAMVTVIGPMQSRIEKLRADWAKALQKPTKEARRAALQELFLPDKSLDKAVPNLSSIVVLVEVAGRRLLLTGDANGKHIVSAWRELGFGDGPVKIDLLKMPHHGSIRNATEEFLQFFVADHYVFSANGKFDNPDAPTLEAVVQLHGNRAIMLHFTNAEITWSKPYELEKDGTSVSNLADMLTALRAAYPGPWSVNLRKGNDRSVVVKLP